MNSSSPPPTNAPRFDNCAPQPLRPQRRTACPDGVSAHALSVGVVECRSDGCALDRLLRDDWWRGGGTHRVVVRGRRLAAPRDSRIPVDAGRARSAFDGFATVLLVALLALAGTESRLIGLVQLLVVVVVLTQSMPFTLAALARWQPQLRPCVRLPRRLGVRRECRHRARGQGVRPHEEVLLATGVLLLLAIALEQLVAARALAPRRRERICGERKGIGPRPAARSRCHLH